MKAILRITEGPAAPGTLTLEPGQAVTVGRGEQAQFQVPDDPLLSSLHLTVRCDEQGCHLEDLHSTNGTTVNGQPVTRKELHDGDVIHAGHLVLRVALERRAATADSTAPTPAAAPTPAPVPAAAAAPPERVPTPIERTVAVPLAELGPERGFIADSAAQVVARFQLADALPVAPADAEPPERYVARLLDEKKEGDALTFLAYALPKRSSVWWSIVCVRAGASALAPDEQAVLALAERWVDKPSEPNRREAMELAQKQGCASAACWPAVAAFWSSGSMAPPNCPPVPPADELCGKGVAGAVALAVVREDLEQAPARQRRFVELGLAVASGENTWSNGR